MGVGYSAFPLVDLYFFILVFFVEWDNDGFANSYNSARFVTCLWFEFFCLEKVDFFVLLWTAEVPRLPQASAARPRCHSNLSAFRHHCRLDVLSCPRLRVSLQLSAQKKHYYLLGADFFCLFWFKYLNEFTASKN